MKNAAKNIKLHHKALHHVKKHKKKYVRFISFFIFLVLYSLVEDIVAMRLHGVELDIIIMLNVFMIATIFTLISEVTERLYRKEEPKIEKFMKKEGRMIQKEEMVIKKRIRKL